MITSKVELVQFIGIIIFAIEIVLLAWLLIKGRTLSATVKWMAFLTLMVGPVILATLGNFYVFDHSKTVETCGNCHVMKPMVNDMYDPESMTLAARHYKNHWIAKDQCYGCHKDYGLNGGLKAKVDGYRHLMRYITSTYHEPIEAAAPFNNNNCGGCHSGTKAFEAVEMHEPLLSQFTSNEISCLNCHGWAHPTRLQRTPGSEKYEQLITDRPVEDDLKQYLLTITNPNSTQKRHEKLSD